MAELAPPPPPPQVAYVDPNGKPTEEFYLWLMQKLVAKINALEARIYELENP